MTRHLVVALLLCGVCAASTPARADGLHRVAGRLFAERRGELLESVAAQGAFEPRAAPTLTSGPGRSTKKAFFLSLLLPGLGQRYLGQDRRAELYMGLEAGVWITVATFWLQGSMREDRYREYAGIVAGADPDDPDDEYYKNLTLYGSSDDYATVIRWEARALYPDDLAAQRRYYEKNIYPGSRAWTWPDKAAFDEYKRLRRRSKRAYRSAVNSVGLAVLNRLVSAIDTVTGQEKLVLTGGWEPCVSVRTVPGESSIVSFFHLRQSF